MLPIRRKLQGLSREGRVMTVSNQVEALIREATDPVHLVSEALCESEVRLITYLSGKDVRWMDVMDLTWRHTLLRSVYINI